MMPEVNGMPRLQLSPSTGQSQFLLPLTEDRQLTTEGLLQKPAAQNTSETTNAGGKQHDGTGFRCGTAGRTAQGERLRRNRTERIFLAHRRAPRRGATHTAVLIPVNRVSDRAAGCGAGILQGYPAGAAPGNAGECVVCLEYGVTIRIGSQKCVGYASQRMHFTFEVCRSNLHVDSRQHVRGGGIPVNEVQVLDAGIVCDLERVGHHKAEVDGPAVGIAVAWTVGVQGLSLIHISEPTRPY